MSSLTDFAFPACRECGSLVVKKPGPGRYPHYCSPSCRMAANPPRRAPADSDALRSRRKRLHAAGDHSLCRNCDSRSNARTACWICSKPMISHGAERPTCAACRRKHGAGVCSECGAPKRLAKPGLCRNCRRPPGESWVAEPRVCELCEETYVPKWKPRPGKQQRWCSKSCTTAWANGARPPYERRVVTGLAGNIARARERRLRHAQTWDGITDEEILERDGWRCQIPGCKRRPIRKDAKYPHLRSKSIDHIVPLSLGGDDTAANKRAAHLGCNMSRGNQVGFEQTALFGVIREPPLMTQIAGSPVRVKRRVRLCRICGEGLEGKKCLLHLPVYVRSCRHCDQPFTARDSRRYACADKECLKRRYADRVPPPLTAEARERKRKRDRERRWLDPEYRARAIAATARWHERNRAKAAG